eukprot:1204271-Pyramimonas_sp.AAC.1
MSSSSTYYLDGVYIVFFLLHTPGEPTRILQVVVAIINMHATLSHPIQHTAQASISINRPIKVDIIPRCAPALVATQPIRISHS